MNTLEAVLTLGGVALLGRAMRTPTVEELDADTAIEVAENDFSATIFQAKRGDCKAARRAFDEGKRALKRGRVAIKTESAFARRNLTPTLKRLPNERDAARRAIKRFCK